MLSRLGLAVSTSGAANEGALLGGRSSPRWAGPSGVGGTSDVLRAPPLWEIPGKPRMASVGPRAVDAVPYGVVRNPSNQTPRSVNVEVRTDFHCTGGPVSERATLGSTQTGRKSQRPFHGLPPLDAISPLFQYERIRRGPAARTADRAVRFWTHAADGPRDLVPQCLSAGHVVRSCREAWVLASRGVGVPSHIGGVARSNTAVVGIK